MVLAGTSESVAVTVKASAASSFVVLFPGFVTTGAEFTSFTVIVIAAELLIGGPPLSVPTIVTGYTPGPCAAFGVQLNAPVVALIVAPVAAGVPSVIEYVNVCPASGSVATTVNASGFSSFTVLFPGFVTVGGLFTTTEAGARPSTSVQSVPIPVGPISLYVLSKSFPGHAPPNDVTSWLPGISSMMSTRGDPVWPVIVTVHIRYCPGDMAVCCPNPFLQSPC